MLLSPGFNKTCNANVITVNKMDEREINGNITSLFKTGNTVYNRDGKIQYVKIKIDKKKSYFKFNYNEDSYNKNGKYETIYVLSNWRRISFDEYDTLVNYVTDGIIYDSCKSYKKLKDVLIKKDRVTECINNYLKLKTNSVKNNSTEETRSKRPSKYNIVKTKPEKKAWSQDGINNDKSAITNDDKKKTIHESKKDNFTIYLNRVRNGCEYNIPITKILSIDVDSVTKCIFGLNSNMIASVIVSVGLNKESFIFNNYRGMVDDGEHSYILCSNNKQTTAAFFKALAILRSKIRN